MVAAGGGALLGCSGGSGRRPGGRPDARRRWGRWVRPVSGGERRPRAAAAGPWPSPCSTPDRSRTRPGPTPGGRDRPRQPVRRPDRHRPGRRRPARRSPPPGRATSALRRWEFRFRPDARWSDGFPVRAADFTFARQRARPTRRRSPEPPRRPDPAVGGHRLPGVHRRPVPDDRRPGVSPTRPPWSSASTVPSPTSRPWSPPSRCHRSPRPWSAPTRPPT